jgi:hypothetical protein
MSDFGILALHHEHIKLLSVLPRVPRDDAGDLDLRVWARMVDIPQRRVRDLSRGLMDMGAILSDGTMPAMVATYLSKLATDCVNKGK